MSTQPPVVVTATDRGLEIHLPALGDDWEGFDRIQRFLILNYAAKVLSQVDGPDARTSGLLVGSTELALEYEDPYGTSLVVSDPSSDVARSIAADLQERLASTHHEWP